MLKEIGSTFWVEPDFDYSKRYDISPEQFNMMGEDYMFLSTGRGCINLVIETLINNNAIKNKTAVIPSFTCYTCATPFEKNGFRIVPIPVNKDLTVSPEVLKKTVIDNNASVVLLHQYYGFETLKHVKSVIEELMELGVIIIEDRTQCLYSDFLPLPADYYVASIRKWAGLIDGGIVVSKKGGFCKKVYKFNREFEKIKLQASIEKYHYITDGVGEKKHFRDLYEKAADKLSFEKDYYAISNSSTCVQYYLDIKQLKTTRKNNYKYLYDFFENEQKLFSTVFTPSEYEVPLYFPMLTKGHRKSLQKYLATKDIYAPIIWPYELNFDVDNNARFLYDDLLCIPIDQRYGLDDMKRVTGEFVNYIRSLQ